MSEHLKAITRRALSISRWLFGPIAVAFLAVAGYMSRSVIVDIVSHARLAPIFLTVALCTLLHPLTALFTWMALRASDRAVPYMVLLRIQIARLPARYLPGGIWQTVSRMMDLHRYGVDKPRLAALVVSENLAPLASALTLGGASLYVSGYAPLFIPLLCIVLGLALMAVVPLALSFKLLLRRGRFKPSYYVAGVGVTWCFWAVASCAFTSYWHAFPFYHAGNSIFKIAGVYLIGWSAGFVAIFAPQGIGVFETATGFLLHDEMPTGEVTAIMLGFRAAVLIADMLLYGVFTMGATLYAKRILWNHGARQD
jgi:glycosyltransferase 2 family protein